ncbi:hypothetical protein GR160_02870 [Flavobacterium sp. Sd200]|uniref:hypothetical protein n=1 Tax=Flavobacterium sp. Sd200 TaxID=2692211 RepID=UPI0013709B86|nr:hypothetical protein [Flavobacterium sp. Sd200]MXN90156.1 hypothetical protein [Flavobacterium sp. Sd200]
MISTTKKKGLNNPAVAAALNSEEGKKAIGSTTENASVAVKAAAGIATDVIPFMIKTALVLGIGWYAFGLFKNRFIKLGINPNYPAANVSDGQAAARASALYEAMYGLGADFEAVKNAISGLNYNGWVKVYNSFGNRKGINILGDEMNLVEWLQDQFNEEDLQELRFLVNGVF